MGTIPMGSFDMPRVAPEPSTRVPDTSPLAQHGRGGMAVGQALQEVADRGMHLAQQRIAQDEQETKLVARATGASAVLDDRIAHKAKVDEIQTKLSTGELTWQKAQEDFQTWYSLRSTPEIKGLDPSDAERMGADLRRNRFEATHALDNIVRVARSADGDVQVGNWHQGLLKLSADPNADIDKIVAQGEQIRPLADELGVGGPKFEKSQAAFADDAYFNHARSRMLADRENPEALAQLARDLGDADGFYASRLSGEKRNILLNSVLGRQDVLDNKAAQQQAKAESRADVALNEWERTIAGGDIAPVESVVQWRTIVDASGSDALKARFNDLQQSEVEVRQLRKLPPAQAEAYLQAKEAKLSSEGALPRDRANLERLRNVFEADRKRLRDAPLEHDARITGTAVEPLDVQAMMGGDVAKVRAQLAERVVRLGAVRKHYGAETGNAVLLPAEASALAAAVKQGGVRQTAQLFGVLNSAIGNPDVYAATMQQIAPDSPVRALAGRVFAWQRAGAQPSQGSITDGAPNGKYGDVAMYLLKGEALINPGKDEAGRDGKGGAFPMPPPDKFRQAVATAVGTAFAGRADDFETTLQAARAYYAARAAEDGNVKGDLDVARVTQAVKAVAGEKVRFEDRDVLPPWGMRGSFFHDLAPRLVSERLKAAGLDDPGDVALMNVRGRDGLYVLVRGIEPLVDRHGIPLTMRVRRPQ